LFLPGGNSAIAIAGHRDTIATPILIPPPATLAVVLHRCAASPVTAGLSLSDDAGDKGLEARSDHLETF
jgi:hypothetical protein